MSVAFSSCKQTTSGLDSRIQSKRLGRRFLMLLMLNVATFMFLRRALKRASLDSDCQAYYVRQGSQ